MRQNGAPSSALPDPLVCGGVACGNGAESSVRNVGSNISLEEFGMDMHGDKSPPFWKSRGAIALLGFGAIAIFFMLSEHRAHFLGVLPFVLLLSCPLMHFFMHHGKHDNDHDQSHRSG
jgi:hypothetical protein